MTPEKLKELRTIVARMPHALESIDDSECDKCIALALIDAELAQADGVCVWAGQNDDVYESRCGRLWTFFDGGPVENQVDFCHGCGKRVEVA